MKNSQRSSSLPRKLLKLAAGAALLLATASAAASADTAAANQDKPASLAAASSATKGNNNAFFAFGPPALTGIAAAALTAPNNTVTSALVSKVDTLLSAKYDPETVAAWRRLVTRQGAINAVAGPALSGDIQCFVGPAGTVVGLRYGSAQVCDTTPNVVDIKIGTGFVSNVKVILSTPNATIAGLEFVVTTGKKSASTFCGRALGLSAWIGKPGQAVGAIGGTCSAPSATTRRRRGRSILEAAEGEEVAAAAAAADDAPSASGPAVVAAANSPSSSASLPPAAPLPLPPLPPLAPPHHANDGEHHRQQPPPPRKHHQHHGDEGAAASPAPGPALVAAAGVAPPPSLSRRKLAQAPTNGTTGGLSAGTLQVVLVPAPQGENNSGAYGNGTIFGG